MGPDGVLAPELLTRGDCALSGDRDQTAETGFLNRVSQVRILPRALLTCTYAQTCSPPAPVCTSFVPPEPFRFLLEAIKQSSQNDHEDDDEG
jgi:hypothetical protein